MLLLTLRGTPFLYAGEELGLEDAVVAAAVVDPGGRDGCRAPIPWDEEPPHGWGRTGPWLPLPPASVREGDGSATRGSDLDALALPRPARAAPTFERAPLGGVRVARGARRGARVRAHATDTDRRVVCVSFVSEPRTVDVRGTIQVSSAPGRAGQAFDGELLPDEAVVLGV